MKRYSLCNKVVDDNIVIDTDMVENPTSGEWVRYTDVPVRTICDVCKENYVDIADRCNCEENSREILREISLRYGTFSSLIDPTPQYWICPKHGYKKI